MSTTDFLRNSVWVVTVADLKGQTMNTKSGRAALQSKIIKKLDGP